MVERTLPDPNKKQLIPNNDRDFQWHPKTKGVVKCEPGFYRRQAFHYALDALEATGAEGKEDIFERDSGQQEKVFSHFGLSMRQLRS